MKKIPLILSAAILFICSSCSLFNLNSGKSNLTFCVDGAMVVQIENAAALYNKTSRSAHRAADDGHSLFIDIKLTGDYTDEKTAEIEDGAVVTFSGLQEGAVVYASGVVYIIQTAEDGTENRVELYKGDSEKITLKNGQNNLELTLNKIKAAEPEKDDSTTTTDSTDTAEAEASEQTLTITVQYYLQNIDDNEYTLQEKDTEVITCTIDESADVMQKLMLGQLMEKTYTGFTLLEDVESESNEEDLTALVKIKLNRNLYKVIYDDGTDDEDIAVPETAEYKYGKEIVIPAEKNPQRPGYIFKCWTDGSNNYIPGDSNPVMGTTDIILTAMWEEETENVGFSFTIVMDENSELSVTKEETTAGYLFKAEAGYDSYKWKLDDEVQTETSNEYLFTKTGLTVGIYDIYLEAQKTLEDGTLDIKSYTIQIKIE